MTSVIREHYITHWDRINDMFTLPVCRLIFLLRGKLKNLTLGRLKIRNYNIICDECETTTVRCTWVQ